MKSTKGVGFEVSVSFVFFVVNCSSPTHSLKKSLPLAKASR